MKNKAWNEIHVLHQAVMKAIKPGLLFDVLHQAVMKTVKPGLMKIIKPHFYINDVIKTSLFKCDKRINAYSIHSLSFPLSISLSLPLSPSPSLSLSLSLSAVVEKRKKYNGCQNMCSRSRN
jgi:hypothetical protein